MTLSLNGVTKRLDIDAKAIGEVQIFGGDYRVGYISKTSFVMEHCEMKMGIHLLTMY